MPIQFSPVFPAHMPGRGGPPMGGQAGGPAWGGQAGARPPEHVIAAMRAQDGRFSVRVLDLHELGDWASPLIFVFQGRQIGGGFPIHPHAGFSAISLVFEDSQTGLRTRDSLGNDFVVDPGGIAWTEAASGVVHDELPAEPERELNGAQIFVNLSSEHKFGAPRVFHLTGSQVPVWQSNAGDRVRVAVGSFRGVSSPIEPIEPFTLLDIDLRREIGFAIQPGHNSVVYVLDGEVRLRADGGGEQTVAGGNALALHGSGGDVTFQASQPTHFLLLSGTEIREPLVFDGNFIMNEPSQLEAARARYQSGEMGRLAPLSASR